MNLIAIDIGNTNITIGLFLNNKEESVSSVPGKSEAKLRSTLKSAWAKIPFVKAAKAKTRDGVIVACSVKPAWATRLRQIVKDGLGEKMLLVGRDVPVPMELDVENHKAVGTDRVVSAAAAYAVVSDAVVVADFGTAVTIDLVNDKGVFLGGVICPGFDMSATALKAQTAQLPKVKVAKPSRPYGTNTSEAIRCGIYYSAIATLQEVIRRYAA